MTVHHEEYGAAYGRPKIRWWKSALESFIEHSRQKIIKYAASLVFVIRGTTDETRNMEFFVGFGSPGQLQMKNGSVTSVVSSPGTIPTAPLIRSFNRFVRAGPLFILLMRSNGIARSQQSNQYCIGRSSLSLLSRLKEHRQEQ